MGLAERRARTAGGLGPRTPYPKPYNLDRSQANNYTMDVWTRATSTSSFISAMTALRSVFLQQVIWGGHVFHMHILQVGLA